MNRAEMIGKRFGRLVVTGLSNHRSGKRKRLIYVCDCDCGNKGVEVIGEKLRGGTTRSCGCLKRETTYKMRKKYNQYYFDENNGCMVGITFNTENKFMFDKEDYKKIKDFCWRELNNGYLVASIGGKQTYMHRLIMDAESSEYMVDHKNHNVKDNRKCNLRICTQLQNSMNAGLRGDNTSGVTGVWYDKKNGKWCAEIRCDHKKIYLGTFNDFYCAVDARRKAEDFYFGEWSYKNSCGVHSGKGNENTMFNVE